MESLKVFIDISSEVNEELYAQGVNLQTLLEEEGFKTGRAEVHIKGEPVSRGILVYAIVFVGGAIASKVLDKSLDKLLDPILDKILDPLLEKAGLKKKEEEEPEKEGKTINVNITVNVLAPLINQKDSINKEEEREEEVLELRPLSEQELKSSKQLILKLEKGKKLQ